MKEPLSTPPGSAVLGASIPSVPHALSVSLPTWKDNVGWAEGDAKVVRAMVTGYPRFFIHRNIQKLAKVCLEVMKNQRDLAILFPTARTAKECHLYLERMAQDSMIMIQVVQFEIQKGSKNTASHESGMELYAVSFSPDIWKIAKSFWQNAGMGISSRLADAILERLAAGSELVITDRPLESTLNLCPGALEEKLMLRRRIASMINTNLSHSNSGRNAQIPESQPAEESHVFLYPSGMSAIWHAHQLSLTFLPGRECICFGFSYTDTIKIIDRWGSGSATFFDNMDLNLEALEKFLPNNPTAALFCEVPSNPLLQTPNLPRLRVLANKYGFLIVVDETVGSFVNVDVFKYADIIVTSLSKLFSGSANVMGGSLVINPNSTHFPFMRAHLKKTFVDDYYHEDAVVMEANSRDFAARVAVINANAVAVAEFLRARSLSFAESNSPKMASDHSEFIIKDVFFPKWVARREYDLCRKPGADDNFGPLLSLTFSSPEASHAFYDALQCAKGPSLGTNFTLACPYTVLAHYNERVWAAGYGIEEGIVRISVGMEERGLLLNWMETALTKAAEKSSSALGAEL